MICTPSHMTHANMINLWPSLSAFAADLGIQYGTAKAIRRRNSIPAEYWLLAVAKADGRGIAGVSLDALARAVAAERDGDANINRPEKFPVVPEAAE